MLSQSVSAAGWTLLVLHHVLLFLHLPLSLVDKSISVERGISIAYFYTCTLSMQMVFTVYPSAKWSFSMAGFVR